MDEATNTPRDPIYKHRPVAPNPAEFGLAERVNDFIVMSEGNSNVYLIETSDGGVLVNTGMGFEAPVHEANLRAHSGIALGDVVTTQGHTDHVGGVQFFRDRNPGLRYVAQANNLEHQAYDRRLARFRRDRSAFAFAERFIEVFARYADAGYTDINAQDEPTPDVTFDDRFDLTRGDTAIELIACPGAETNDSLVVWLPEQRICFTGNLFGCPFGHFPNLVTIRGDRYRDALVCARAAQTVIDLEPDMILYGHHEPVAGQGVIREELVAYRDAIHHVHDETVRGMNEGKDVHTLMAEIALPDEVEVGQGYGKVSWGVRAIWENYAGWFHHTSTTELYSVPPSAVSEDLVELAGADRLVERAREHRGAGEHERALHLLDVILEADPDNARARAVAADVHDDLLESSQNFWLSAWLEQRRRTLGGEDATRYRFS